MTYISTRPCKADFHIEVAHTCQRCEKNQVCKNCEFIVDNLSICQECEEEIQQDAYEEDGICPNCGEECEPIYENNGFTEPEGPSHWEVTGYKPCANCNAPEYEPDDF